MKLTVLGKSPAWADAGGACSGYLVEGGGVRLLLDCGHGVVGVLRERMEPHDVDAVFVSHMHADHAGDLMAFAYALKFMPHEKAGHRPLLLVPGGGRDLLRRMARMWGDSGELFDTAFRVCELTDGSCPRQVGGLSLRWAEVPHSVSTFAVDVRSDDGGRVTYGADCGPNGELVRLASGTPLLICEATVPEPFPGHLTAAQAGEIASTARARRLLVTHFSDLYDRRVVRAYAQSCFIGRVDLADPGFTVTLTGS